MELQLQNLKPTKSDIKIASDILIQQVDNGEVNAIDVALQLKVIEEFVKDARERLNKYTIDELYKHQGGKVNIYDAKIETAETGVKYDYSGDSTWTELRAKSDELTSAPKQREDLLKKIPAGHTLVDENGEAAIGPTKTSTTSYKITLAK
jgi:predicted heme/steroid binding protein